MSGRLSQISDPDLDPDRGSLGSSIGSLGLSRGSLGLSIGSNASSPRSSTSSTGATAFFNKQASAVNRTNFFMNNPILSSALTIITPFRIIIFILILIILLFVIFSGAIKTTAGKPLHIPHNKTGYYIALSVVLFIIVILIGLYIYYIRGGKAILDPWLEVKAQQFSVTKGQVGDWFNTKNEQLGEFRDTAAHYTTIAGKTTARGVSEVGAANPRYILAFFVILLIILILIILFVMFPSSIPEVSIKDINQQNAEKGNTALIVITFIIVIASIIVFFAPSFSQVKTIIGNLSGIITIICYLIFILVLFRSLIPPDTLNTYSKILLPLTLLPGAYLFYREITRKPPGPYTNLNYERIKFSLLYFCLIVFILIFYTCDPGGYIKQAFGPITVFTILLLVFGFLFLLTVMIPESMIYGSNIPPTVSPGSDGKPFPKKIQEWGSTTGFFKGFTWIGGFNVFCFLFFLTLASYGIYTYPNDNPTTKNGLIAGTVIIFLLWIPLTIYTLFPNSPTSATIVQPTITNYKALFQRVLLIIFGLLFSSFLIYVIVNSTKNLTSTSGIGSFILNLIIVIACLGIIFKIISSTETYQKSHVFKLIVNTALYIPCIIVVVVDYMLDILGLFIPTKVGLPKGISMPNGKLSIKKTGAAISSGYNSSKEAVVNGIENVRNTNMTYFVLLFVIIIAYVIYFGMPYISDYFAKQGGQLLINQPVYLNEVNTLGSYQNLNQSTDYDYNYGISFWFCIDDHGPNTNGAYSTYTSLLNYGDKPNVLYDASYNTVRVTMMNTTGEQPTSQNMNQYDANGNYIICEIPDILLQKWNCMIINYTGGTLDIFYNGELVKSFRNIVPQMSYDTLTTGSSPGLLGGICNVNYFKNGLTSSQIYYLYNLVKNKTPPVTISDDTTVQQIKEYIAPVTSTTNQVVSKTESSVSNTGSTIKTFFTNIGNNITGFFLKK